MTLRTAALATFATTLSLAGCFGELPADGVGSAVAEVQTIPAGVGCLRVVFRAPGATNDTTRNLGVTPGNPATLDLGYLAAGAYSFRANAYNVACGSVVAATVPTWVGDPAAATIAPGIATTVPITLRPNVMTRTTVDFVQPVRAIYSGTRSWATYAVMQDGTVRAWGMNTNGQLGDGTRMVATTPRVVAGLNGPTQIAAWYDFACATTPNGLACWGSIADQLADGYRGESLVPRINPDLNPDMIAVGMRHICGRLNGRVACWGASLFGVAGGMSAESIEATSFATGSESAWGDEGLFVVDSFTNLLRTNPVTPGTPRTNIRQRVLSISLGASSYCAIVGGGGVVCAGPGVAGVAGGGGSPLEAPVANGVTGAIALTSGEHHHCALRDDRTVVCWGLNSYGQVGGGLEENVVTTPTTVPLRDVVQVAAGFSHTCALVADGSVWCWGLNTAGQLGDGTNVPRFTPVRVRF
jgi:hypothetical protein